MPIDRRTLLKAGGLTALAGLLPGCSRPEQESAAPAAAPARHGRLHDPHRRRARRARARSHHLNDALQRAVSRTAASAAGGPAGRLIDVYNDTDTPEQLHWHGQTRAGGRRRRRRRGHALHSGARHGGSRSRRARPASASTTRTSAPAPDLRAGTVRRPGRHVYIEPKHEPGAYDREVFLVLKEFEPSFSRGGDMPMDFLAPAGARSGSSRPPAKAR